MLLVRMTSVFIKSDSCCVKKSEWNVVALGRAVAFDGFGGGSGSGWSGTRSARSSGSARSAAFASTRSASKKLNNFSNDTQTTFFLAGLFIVPLIKLEPTFN